jgi:hypothetical protein
MIPHTWCYRLGGFSLLDLVQPTVFGIREISDTAMNNRRASTVFMNGASCIPVSTKYVLSRFRFDQYVASTFRRSLLYVIHRCGDWVNQDIIN